MGESEWIKSERKSLQPKKKKGKKKEKVEACSDASIVTGCSDWNHTSERRLLTQYDWKNNQSTLSIALLREKALAKSSAHEERGRETEEWQVLTDRMTEWMRNTNMRRDKEKITCGQMPQFWPLTYRLLSYFDYTLNIIYPGLVIDIRICSVHLAFFLFAYFSVSNFLCKGQYFHIMANFTIGFQFTSLRSD